MDLHEISDRLEIDVLLTRYTRAIDTGEWDRLDDVFTPDAQIDYTATGGIAAPYPEVKAWLAEMLPIFPRRLHTLGQVDSRWTATPLSWRRTSTTRWSSRSATAPRRRGVRRDLPPRPRPYDGRLALAAAVEEIVWKRGM